jgi:hypothetical protein
MFCSLLAGLSIVIFLAMEAGVAVWIIKVKNRGGRDASYLPYYSVPMALAPFTIPIFVFCCCKLKNAVRSSSSTV